MAEANFGPAEFVAHSTKAKAVLRTASELHPGRIYRWEINKRCPNGDIFLTCNNCRKRKTARNSPHANFALPRIKVSLGVLRVDPDHPATPHFCTGEDKKEYTVKELNSTVRTDMVQGTKRPTRAYQEMCAKIPRLAETPQFRRDVENALPALQSMRRGLNRWRIKENANYDRVEDVPDNHKCTLATVEEPVENRESYVIYQRAGQRQTLILGSRSDVRTLAILRHIIGDGTFKYCPRGFAQLYAIHGMIENDLGFEWKVLIVALLPDKTQETYTLLFQQLRRTLIEMFPANEPFINATIHFDFELAAINACKVVFPLCKVCGCQFHYGQCHIRHAQACGLQSAYQRRVEPFNSPEFDPLRIFIKRSIALSMLPAELERPYWDTCLRNSMPVFAERAELDPQHNIRVALNRNVRNYRDYVENTWLTPGKITLANQYYNDGNRTNNGGEGWNNSLSTHFDHQQHMRLSEFLLRYQEMHHSNQIRIRQLQRNEPPVARRERYVQNDHRIVMAKWNLWQFWGNEMPVQPLELINERLTRYLDHMAHCLGVDKKFGVTAAERQAQEAHQAIEANNWFIINNNVNEQAANDIENVRVANVNENLDPFVIMAL